MSGASLNRETGSFLPNRPIKRLIAPIFLIVVGLCGISLFVLNEARRAYGVRAGEVASSLVTAIASDISNNIETLNLSLQAVAENLKYVENKSIDPELRQVILFDRSATARHLGSMLVLDKDGYVRLDSRTLNPTRLDLSDRDYFQVHRDNPFVGMYIGKPVLSRISHQWIIGVSRRLSNSDGSFAGVAVASLRLTYFQQLFKNAVLGPAGNITLANTDGTVLMRWPFEQGTIGNNIRQAKLYEYFARSPSGQFESNTMIDGLRRLVVYSQIGNLPLIVGVGQSTKDIYGNWRDYAVAVGILIAVLSALSLGLAGYLARELRRRKEAEISLSVQANTDALTGLFNKRYFGEVFDLEWRRATREQQPISLLMIDVDLFKAYNDALGHVAGDKLLWRLGSAIKASLNRGGDFGARFGGDEFVILLPGVSSAQAVQLAEKIRRQFERKCNQDNIEKVGLSIGAACVFPRIESRTNDLLRLADEALYCAKNLGRNRTEVSSIRPDRGTTMPIPGKAA